MKPFHISIVAAFLVSSLSHAAGNGVCAPGSIVTVMTASQFCEQSGNCSTLARGARVKLHSLDARRRVSNDGNTAGMALPQVDYFAQVATLTSGYEPVENRDGSGMIVSCGIQLVGPKSGTITTTLNCEQPGRYDCQRLFSCENN